MLIEVTVAGLAQDPRTDSPILLLRDDTNSRILPIWIGIAEATAIAAQVEGIQLPRPMTHDLAQSIVLSLGGRISRVSITSLEDATFYAQITLVVEEAEHEVDARPSDAVALALRAEAPIFVDDAVFKEGSAVVVEASEVEDADLASEASTGGADAVQQTPAERWNTLLDHLNEDDGGDN